MTEVRFLKLEEILIIHEDQIKRYGGLHGVRDIYLLESAIAQPIAKYQKKYLHKNIYQMAAAYLFHICMNHPFNDGNKRTALVSMILFLRLNGIYLNCEEKNLELLVLNVPQKKTTKAKIAQFLKKHSLMERNL